MSPKLSVCFITYNHEKFVRQALDSVLMQQCNFDFEIVIGDDCSTDSTSKIIEEYAAKYPDKIRLNVFEKNVGMTSNWVSTIGACKGEYVALLEGDDFWTDPLKLQKQIALLEKNSDYVFIAHDVEVIRETSKVEQDYLLHIPEDSVFTIRDFLDKGVFLQTASIVFRREALLRFPTWADKRVKTIDTLVYLLLSSKGSYYYLAQKMSCYRMHVGGVSHTSWKKQQNTFEFDVVYVLKHFNAYSNYQFNKEVEDKIEFYYLRIIRGNPLTAKVYKKAMFGLMKIRPKKHFNLLKGYIINNLVPPMIYRVYRKILKTAK